MDDKTADMDNYYLTLYGIAQELSLAGITDSHVHLAVGLPLMWYSEQRESFAEYLRQNEYVEFGYNCKTYHIYIDSVSVYPQGYCAVYDKLRDMDGVNMIADIGNGTMNILKVIDHKCIIDSCRTEKLGVEKCVFRIRNAVMNKFTNVLTRASSQSFSETKSRSFPKNTERSWRTAQPITARTFLRHCTATSTIQS